MADKPILEVCLTNSMMHQHEVQGKLVVFIDVLRNTSTMTAALFHGIKKVKPTATVEEAAAFLGAPGYIVGGERHGNKIADFDTGNSPLHYVNNEAEVKDKTLVITSTNGTQSVSLARECDVMSCGGFVNQSALIDFILSKNMPTLLLASGWRGQVNLEDTLFAGAVVKNIKDYFQINSDHPTLAEMLYTYSHDKILEIIYQKSYFQLRLGGYDYREDIHYCFTKDIAPVIPIYDGEFLNV